MRWLLLHLTKSIVGLGDLRAALAALLVAVTSTSSHAYAPLNTDDALTVGKGTNQVEIYFSQINEHTQGGAAEVADIAHVLRVQRAATATARSLAPLG